ncbi:hypothetical protein NIES2109_23040 [Nostoc sp. HK-01]|nr:hypothetical protein NIES2109_23040 [Nostoc sp. HK-01]
MNNNISKTDQHQQQLAVSITPEMQNRVLDQVLIQSSGVGLGIILSILGMVALAEWLGLRAALRGWIDRQKVESEALKNLSNAFTLFLSEYKRDNADIQNKLQNLYDKPCVHKR